MERFLVRGKIDGQGRPIKNVKDEKASPSPPVKMVESESDQEESESEGENDSSEDGEAEGETERRYIVERIDDKRVDEDGITYYYIKWKDWDVSTNTWEPLENLDDCSALLADFERRYAEGKIPRQRISRGRKRKRPSVAGAVKRKDDDEDGDSNQVQSNVKTYCVLDEWRANMEPLSVEGVMNIDGELTYVVKQNTRRGGLASELDRSNAVLIKAANFRQVYPELVIDFYQSRVIWGAGENDDEEEESNEQFSVAAQIKKFCKLDNEDDNNENEKVIGEILQNDNATSKTEEEYAEFPEDYEETDLSSGMTSVASVDESELDSEVWKQFLEGDDGDW